MELKDYISVLRRRFLWILAVAVIFAGIYVWRLFDEEAQYTSTSSVILRIEDPTAFYYRQMGVPLPSGSRLTATTREEQIKGSKVMELAAEVLAAQKLLDESGADRNLFEEIYDASTGEDALRVRFKDQETQDEQPPDQDLGPGEVPVRDYLRQHDLEKIRGDIAELLGREHPLRDKEKRREKGRRIRARVKILRSDERKTILTISSTDEDPKKARDRVNAVACAMALFSLQSEQKNIKNLIGQRKDTLRVLKLKRDRLQEEAPTEEAEQLRRQERLHVIQAQLAELADQLRERELTVQTNLNWIDQYHRAQLREREIPLGEAELPPFELPPTIEEIESRISEVRAQIITELTVRMPDHPSIQQLEARKKMLEAQFREKLDEESGRHMMLLLSENERLQVERDELDSMQARLAEEAQLLQEARNKATPIIEAYRGLREQMSTIEKDLRKLEDYSIVVVGFVDVHELARKAYPETKTTERSLLFWAIIALLVSVGVAFLREYTDTRITTEYDVRRHMNLPVLGIVPFVEDAKLHLARLAEKGGLAEVFHTIATLIRTSLAAENLSTMLVCSAKKKEGKTTICANLGVALARKGLRVALLDTDLRIPQLHSLFGVDNSQGITTLTNMTEWPPPADADGSWLAPYLQPTEVPNLFVIPSGPIPESPMGVLESPRIRQIMEEARQVVDFVLFDTPPIEAAGDTLILAPLVDANIFTVGAGMAERREVSWAKHLLGSVDAQLLGVILNRAVSPRGVEYYYYYSYEEKRVRQRK